MDIVALKREFGRHITFWGAVSNQHVLAQMKPAEVAASVQRTVDVMGPGGGYLAAPCHTITEDIPWDNVLRFHEAVRCQA